MKVLSELVLIIPQRERDGPWPLVEPPHRSGSNRSHDTLCQYNKLNK